MIRTTILALLASTCIAGTIVAQDAAQDAAPEAVTDTRAHPILRLDTDNDGEVSLEEAQAAPVSPMALADGNGDGILTRDEFVAVAIARAAERANGMFDRLADEGAEEIALEDLPQLQREDRIARMFARADTDGDGVLSAAEIDDMPMRGMGHERGEGFGRHGDGGHRGGRDGGHGDGGNGSDG